MRAMLAVGAFTCLLSVLPAVPATGADRLSDKDVKKLLEQVNNNRDRFEDQLDGKVKRSILRGPRGEVNVEQFLDDLQENVKKLKVGEVESLKRDAKALASRLESGEPASGEAKQLLQRLAAVRTASASRQLSPAAQNAWTSIRGAVAKVAQGFGMPASVP